MRRVLTVVIATLLAGGAAYAQAPAQPAPAAPRQTVPVQPASATPAQAAPAPRPAPAAPAAQTPRPATPQPFPALPVNIRIDIVVIDEGGPQPRRESVALTTSDREAASSRSNAGSVTLNVDATPVVSGLPPGKVRIRMSLDYRPIGEQAPGRPNITILSFSPVLDDGKMMVVSDTTDPGSERRIRVEVTATILK